MANQREKKSREKFRDYLPEHIGVSVLNDLSHAVDTVRDEGPKGRYLGEQYLSKYCDSTTTPSDVRRMAAIKKWLATEERNAETNQRLMFADENFGWTTWEVLRAKVRTIVSDILGPMQYPDILMSGMHTNGASTRIGRSVTAAADKFTGKAHGSSSALKHWQESSFGTILEAQCIESRESSSLFTVPKSSDIDRVACKEPEINMFLQRSVGNHIRRNLKRIGIDLNDQSRNRDLARIGVKKHLATIDLSSASDSISRQLVIELLPFEWWSLLDDLRVKETMVDGQIHELEMFSSMGNGFTFELESLLFYAITRAVCWESGVRGTISVYGDDIIAPNRVVPRLKRIFFFFGFLFNSKKSAWTGVFRESCGGHYHNSLDITPFYVKEPIRKLSDLIRVLNQVLEWDARGYGFFTTEAFAAFHHKWSALIPSALWGGQDVSSIDSLVTGHEPRKRILHNKKKVKIVSTLTLLWWLTSGRLASQRFLRGVLLSTDPSDEVRDPLVSDPADIGKPYLAKQDCWLDRTTWTPYLIYEG